MDSQLSTNDDAMMNSHRASSTKQTDEYVIKFFLVPVKTVAMKVNNKHLLMKIVKR